MHSKIGFHLGPGGNKNGLGIWEHLANGQGIPFGFKAVDEYGPIYEAVQIGNQYQINNWLGFRYTKQRIGREVPNYHLNPVHDAESLAQTIIENLPVEFSKSVWIEAINEPRDENSPGDITYNNMNACDYLGAWCLAAAKYFNTRGYKFMGPAFNSGRPGRNGLPLSDAVAQYAQPNMLKYLAYCAVNPTMAGLAVHEYSWGRWEDGETPADWYPSLWGRFEAAIAAADLHGISRTFPIFVTEFGFDLYSAPTMPDVGTFLDDRNKMIARWPQLKFDASWTLQSGWGAVDNHVNSWLQYPINKQFSIGSQPAPTHSAFGGTLPMAITLPAKIKHTIHLLPQNTTLNELGEVTLMLHPTRSAFTYSADVAHAVLYAGTPDSKVVIWAGERWQGGIPAITKWFTDRGVTLSQIDYRNFGGGSTPVPFHFGRLKIITA